MEWWKEYFDEPYAKAILESFEERASGEVDFIEDVLSLPGNAKILDLCCGLGRHSIELAKRGYKVTGVDVTGDYLETARNKTKKREVKIDFIESDMRDISFNKKFDAVINMFTSFGFFEEENDNFKVLKNVSNALKPGGKFLIDVINRD
jgi:2-polyprenyl-3-methyl-5-hydroxy-6-metoxy-1,4-benzoquinol methylase